MKKKLLAILLSLVAVVAFAGVAVTASAAGTKDAVTVKNANFATDWNMVLFETDTPSGATEPWGTADPSHITVIAPDGSILAPNAVHLNNYIYIGVNNNTEPAVGTTFTIHAGYAYTANSEVKEDITWKYSTQGATFTKVEPTGAVESVAVAGELTVQAGATALDLSALRGKATYADGEVVPFLVTKDMISGEYDLTKAGDYTLTCTYEEKTASVKLTVTPSDELPELTVNNINYDPGWGGFLINFNVKDKVDTENVEGKVENVKITNSVREDISGEFDYMYHETYLFCLHGPNEVGTVITVKEGFEFSGHQMKADVSYIYATAGATLVAYDPAKHDPKTLTIDNNPEDNAVHVGGTLQLTATLNDGAASTVHYTTSDAEVATVDATGKVLGVKEGTATITAKAGDLSKTYEVEVLPELEMKGLEFATSYKIYVEKGGKLALPSDFTAHAVFDNDGKDVYGSDFKLNEENCTLSDVDTATVGTKVSKATVSFAGKQYTLDVSVEVYEVIPMDIKEVAVVEWFSYSIFVQYPDSTVNVANITDATCIPDATKYVYTRADGTEVKCGTYNLGGGNVAILPTFYDGKQDADNWNKAPYMQEGDRITLKAGFSGYMWTGELAPTETDNAAMKAGTGMIVPECRLAEEVTFVFDGMVWGIYIPYTDLKVNETATVQVGDTVSLGAVRVPDTATEGNFYYKSSDESIVTVNNNGRITGVKQGTATVTVTLKDGVAGEKTKTVTVTVTDGIVGLEFAEGTVLTVKKGTEKLDLSGLTANLVWASGKTEKADLSKAEIVGYDKDAAGESEVTVKVTVDGKTYQAQLTVRVQRGGCGSVAEAGASVFAGAVIALSAAALVVGFRKKAKK